MENALNLHGDNPFTETVRWAQENYRTASDHLHDFIMKNACVLSRYRELQEAQTLSQECLAKALSSYNAASVATKE